MNTRKIDPNDPLDLLRYLVDEYRRLVNTAEQHPLSEDEAATAMDKTLPVEGFLNSFWSPSATEDDPLSTGVGRSAR